MKNEEFGKIGQKLEARNRKHAEELENILKDKKLGKKRYLIWFRKYLEYPSLLTRRDPFK